MKKDRPIAHRVEYGFYLLLKGFLRALPHRGARAFGRWVGALGHALDRRHREIALRNMALALPRYGRGRAAAAGRRVLPPLRGRPLRRHLRHPFQPHRALSSLYAGGVGAPRRGRAAGQGALPAHRPPRLLGALAAAHRPHPRPDELRRPPGGQPLPRPRAARHARAFRQHRDPQARSRPPDAGGACATAAVWAS